MRTTTAVEKLVPSTVNGVVAIFLSLPVLYFLGPVLVWKLSAIAVFYAFQILDTQRNNSFRCFGMRMYGTVWEKQYPSSQQALYSVLYTMSFASLFFSLYAPFDLFLFNMLLLQLPCIFLTGTTLHGYLAGGLVTKKSV